MSANQSSKWIGREAGCINLRHNEDQQLPHLEVRAHSSGKDYILPFVHDPQPDPDAFIIPTPWCWGCQEVETVPLLVKVSLSGKDLRATDTVETVLLGWGEFLNWHM